MCETSKEAWEILDVIYEGINTVRNSKIRHLTLKFKTIRMKDNKTFPEFDNKLKRHS